MKTKILLYTQALLIIYLVSVGTTISYMTAFGIGVLFFIGLAEK